MLVGVYEDLAVPQDYLDKNIPVAENQIVIGGYRLAYVINFIFGDSSITSSTQTPFKTDFKGWDKAIQ